MAGKIAVKSDTHVNVCSGRDTPNMRKVAPLARLGIIDCIALTLPLQSTQRSIFQDGFSFWYFVNSSGDKQVYPKPVI